MVRVLQVITSLEGGGGVQMLLKNYHKYIDKSKIIFDFIVYGDRIGELEQYFESYGSKIYHIPPKTKSLVKSLYQMNKIIKNGDYDVVHAHQDIMSVFPMYFAKRAGINIRIAHSHNVFNGKNRFKKLIDQFLRVYIKKYSNSWMACGRDAAIELWGENAVNKGCVQIMNNAIDIDRFIFNIEDREKLRKELYITDKFVIGNIGRLSYSKNHEFMLNVFKEVHKINKNSVLLLVGKGELEENIKKQVKELGLEESVRFLGLRNDIDKVLQAIDIFLMPSRFEGLPVSLIEAQASDLKCIVSDVITKEVNITDKIEYISLDNSPSFWAKKLLEYNKNYKRIDRSKSLKKSGFDVYDQVKNLEILYGI